MIPVPLQDSPPASGSVAASLPGYGAPSDSAAPHPSGQPPIVADPPKWIEESPWRPSSHKPLSAVEAATLLSILDTPGSVAHAASARGIAADAFLALLANPAARQAIADVQAFAAARREIRADAEREELTAILREVARSSTDLVEKRLAATAALRALDRATGYAPCRSSRRVAGANNPAHADSDSRARASRRPRRIADFTFSDPAEAERLLEKERRENDRLEKLIQRTLALTDGLRAPTSPTRERGSHPRRNPAPMPPSSNPVHAPPHTPAAAAQHAAAASAVAEPSTHHEPRALLHDPVTSRQSADLLPVIASPPASAPNPAAMIAAAGRAVSIHDVIRIRAPPQDTGRRTHDLSAPSPQATPAPARAPPAVRAAA